MAQATNGEASAGQQQCLDTIGRTARHCDYFVLSGSATPGLDAGFSAAVARAVGAAGGELIADIAGTQLTAMLAERVFLLRLDRVEAAALIGYPITTYADAGAANSLLRERGACDHAITTVGALARRRDGASTSGNGVCAPALTATAAHTGASRRSSAGLYWSPPTSAVLGIMVRVLGHHLEHSQIRHPGQILFPSRIP